MCYETKCRSCGKSTWQGCGMHVASALKNVMEEDRCPNWKDGATKPCGEVNDNNGGGFGFMSMLGFTSK